MGEYRKVLTAWLMEKSERRSGKAPPTPDLVAAARALLTEHGSRVPSVVGLSANALTRVAAALPVHAGTLAVLRKYLETSGGGC